MTLRFDKNLRLGVDKRKIEYDQSIIQLGLVKADLQKEVGKVEQRIRELGVIRVDTQKDINREEKELQKIVNKREKIEKEIEQAVLAGGAKVADLLTKKDKVAEKVDQKQDKLKELEGYLTSIMDQIQVKVLNRSEFQRDADAMREKLRVVKSELNTTLRELEEAKSEIQATYRARKTVLDDLEAATRELQEVEEMVSVLKASNKEGLDLTASFEGERKRLADKEDFLRRKEADLAVYENRLKKRMDEAGVDIKMTFK